MIQVIERSFELLDLLADGPLALATLSDRTGVGKTTLRNILRTLEGVGAVARDDERRYALGPALRELAERRLGRQALRRAAETLVRELASRLGETVNVSVLRGDTREMLAFATGDRSLLARADRGRAHLFAVATGRVLVAHLPPTQRARLVDRVGMPDEAWDGIRDLPALEAACAAIRRAGYAQASTRDGAVTMLAAPAHWPDGRCAAALGIAVPEYRFKADHRREVMRSLSEGTRSLSADLADNAPAIDALEPLNA